MALFEPPHGDVFEREALMTEGRRPRVQLDVAGGVSVDVSFGWSF